MTWTTNPYDCQMRLSDIMIIEIHKIITESKVYRKIRTSNETDDDDDDYCNRKNVHC